MDFFSGTTKLVKRMGAFLAGMPLVFPGLLKIHNPSKQYLLNPDCKVLPGIAGFL